jgi:hypothetical protein
MALHIFFDNSNIWGGAQAVRNITEPGVPWPALRIYYRNLFALIENGRAVSTRILAGSVPPSCAALWEYARDHGYNTDLLHRVERDDGSIGEQGVDEVLHLKIANAILDHAAPQTLVVATGDGKLSEFGTGFPTQIERALKHGWDAELWSWGLTLKENRYRKLETESKGRFKIKLLDVHYRSLTFVKGGQYYERDAAGTKSYYTVPERVVENL